MARWWTGWNTLRTSSILGRLLFTTGDTEKAGDTFHHGGTEKSFHHGDTEKSERES
jgi:hypothetical protein